MVNYYKKFRINVILLKQNYFYSSTDMWGLGCLVWESYNGPLANRSNLKIMSEVNYSKNNI